jgi:hypothetical protein
LLNLCIPLKDKKGDLTTFQSEIRTYFAQKEEEAKKHHQGKEQLPHPLSNINLAGIHHLIKIYPQLFIDAMSPFKIRDIDKLADTIIQRIFPEIFETEKRSGVWGNL